jgi:hypothetical protein
MSNPQQNLIPVVRYESMLSNKWRQAVQQPHLTASKRGFVRNSCVATMADGFWYVMNSYLLALLAISLLSPSFGLNIDVLAYKDYLKMDDSIVRIYKSCY